MSIEFKTQKLLETPESQKVVGDDVNEVMVFGNDLGVDLPGFRVAQIPAGDLDLSPESQDVDYINRASDQYCEIFKAINDTDLVSEFRLPILTAGYQGKKSMFVATSAFSEACNKFKIENGEDEFHRVMKKNIVFCHSEEQELLAQQISVVNAAQGIESTRIVALKDDLLAKFDLSEDEKSAIPEGETIDSILESDQEPKNFFSKRLKSFVQELGKVDGFDLSSHKEFFNEHIQSARTNEKNPVESFANLLEVSQDVGFDESVFDDVKQQFNSYVADQSVKAESVGIEKDEKLSQANESQSSEDQAKKKGDKKKKEQDSEYLTHAAVGGTSVGLCFIPFVGPFLAAGLAYNYLSHQSKVSQMHKSREERDLDEMKKQAAHSVEEKISALSAARSEPTYIQSSELHQGQSSAKNTTAIASGADRVKTPSVKKGSEEISFLAKNPPYSNMRKNVQVTANDFTATLIEAGAGLDRGSAKLRGSSVEKKDRGKPSPSPRSRGGKGFFAGELLKGIGEVLGAVAMGM